MNNWDIIELSEVESTNDEVVKYCKEPQKYYVVRADKQIAGRGKRGRNWISSQGNLFFSLAMEFDLKNIGHLVAICGLSLAEVIKSLDDKCNVELKWPNDVLINGAKVSGILLEKGPQNYIIIGIGVNIMKSPNKSEVLYKTQSLADAGIYITSHEFMYEYLKQIDKNLNILRNSGFTILQNLWNQLAKNLHSEIIVKQDNRTVKGIFEGIDTDASLILVTQEGKKKILVGDVFFKEDRNE